jgi:Holliday junction resolvasome RuvABC endonuclease subunit
MKTRICGIDPGLLGGIGFLDLEDGKLTSCASLAMPVNSWRAAIAGKTHNTIDVVRLHEHIASQEPDQLVIEQQRGYPNQSSVSGHTSGTNYGLILSLSLLRIPMTLVQPDQWKKKLGLSADKQEAIDLAREIFGPAAPKRDGPAEALLIAWYSTLD